MGPVLLRCCRFQERSQQCRCGGYVLARPAEEWRPLVVLADPLVRVTSYGACSPTVPAMLDLALEPRMLLR